MASETFVISTSPQLSWALINNLKTVNRKTTVKAEAFLLQINFRNGCEKKKKKERESPI